MGTVAFTVSLVIMLFAVSLLSGCSGLGGESSGNSYANSAPLPDVKPITAVASAPLKRRARPQGIGPGTSDIPPNSVLLYASLTSQAHLMKLGTDPTTGTRIWENYLRANQLPFVRVTGPEALSRVSTPGLLILASTVVLSDVEQQAVLEWRNRGGAVLSTWLTAAYSSSGELLGFDFMRDVLDVKVVGSTKEEADDTFMIVHGNSPISHNLLAGTRVWLERVPNQLPVRLVGKQESAQIMNWSRNVNIQNPSGLISYNERKMPSGLYSRTATIGYPEQNWQRSDPLQLNAISKDVFAWLQRQPSVYLSAWPFPYRSAVAIAIQAAEQVVEGDVAMAQTIADMGGKATFYLNGSNAEKAAPMIKKVQAQSHEIAYLGDSFEGFKDQPKEKQSARLDEMQRQLAAAGIVVPMPASFAPPLDSMDQTTQALLQEKKFDNFLAFMDASDSSLPFIRGTTADLTEPIVVMPRTLIGPEEAVEADVTSGLDNFLGELDVSVRMGGLSVVRIPSQSLLLPEQRKRIFDKLLSLRGKVWMSSAKDIARWWRNREQVAVHLAPHPEGYVINAKVSHSITAQEPLSIMVNLPHPNRRVRLQPMQNGDKLPEVMVVDSERVTLKWLAPAAGQYAWLLTFEETASHEKQ